MRPLNLGEQADFATDVLQRAGEDVDDLAMQALLGRVGRVSRRERDVREEVAEEARVCVRGVDAVLGEVEREERGRESACARGSEEGVFRRRRVGSRSRKRGEMGRQRHGHCSYLEIRLALQK